MKRANFPGRKDKRREKAIELHTKSLSWRKGEERTRIEEIITNTEKALKIKDPFKERLTTK